MLMGPDTQKPLTSPKARTRGWRRRRRLLWVAGVVLVSPLLLLLTFEMCVWWAPFQPPGPTRSSTWIEDRNGKLLGAFAAADGQWRYPLTSEEIPAHLANAIIAAEDARFYEHAGIDWKAVGAAVWQDASSLRVRRGASTLSMQLQRLSAGLPRTVWGKWWQAVGACQLERQLTKREILTEYLNRAPFGGNLVGARAAAWRYFGKECSALSLGEAALLAGIPQSPSHLRPDRHPQTAAARRHYVLDRMLAASMITQKEREDADAEAIAATWLPLPQKTTPAPDANGLAPTLLHLAYQPPAWRTRLTIDTAMQQFAARLAGEHLARLSHSGAQAIAVVVLDTSSAQCLANVSVARPGNNVELTRCPRSTGSVLKPFIFAAAFANGIVTPTSWVFDTPRAWPGYVPGNYDGLFAGRMNAGDALAASRNIPAMDLLARLDVGYTIEILHSLGLRQIGEADRHGLSLAIGGAEATPLQVAEAFATLARGGNHLRVTQIVSPAAPAEVGQRVLPDWACWQTMAACSESRRTARISPAAAEHQIAWKTGTSSAHRDAWCAAATPSLTVVTWVGRLDGGSVSGLAGAEAAAPLALEILATLDRNVQPWPAPHTEGVRVAAVPPVPACHVVMISPRQDAEIIAAGGDNELASQMALKARVTGVSQAASERLWWFVDGTPVASCLSGQPAWWTPSPGAHRVTVSTVNGDSASVQVHVR